VENEQVQAMLLLHGLHPDDLETRVRRAVDRLRPHLGVHGLRLHVVEIASGIVRLRLHGSGAAAIKAPLLWTLPGEIEGAVVEAAPDVEKVLIDGLDLAEPAAEVRAAE
jgi:Fe-S cluster biogenesis protein NfuA